jgi:hypothetical protein
VDDALVARAPKPTIHAAGAAQATIARAHVHIIGTIGFGHVGFVDLVVGDGRGMAAHDFFSRPNAQSKGRDARVRIF